ncbi:hypothetical protein Tco_0069589, partial [Tanacetum coccineum]
MRVAFNSPSIFPVVKNSFTAQQISFPIIDQEFLKNAAVEPLGHGALESSISNKASFIYASVTFVT